MSTRKKLLNPIAGTLGVVAGVGSFLLIPGLAAALPAALGIGALAYGATVAAAALRGEARPGTARPAVGAAGEAGASPRIKRGSRVEAWQQRGYRALETMRQIVASCPAPVIAGQLENALLEASDSRAVLDELAMQTAVVEHSMSGLSPAALQSQRDHLQAVLADPATPPAEQTHARDGLDAVGEQTATLQRLRQQQAGLTARMESVVLGLERLGAEMSETVAMAATSAPGSAGDPAHLQDLAEQLEGLRLGLDESRRYTAQILGPDAE